MVTPVKRETPPSPSYKRRENTSLQETPPSPSYKRRENTFLQETPPSPSYKRRENFSLQETPPSPSYKRRENTSLQETPPSPSFLRREAARLRETPPRVKETPPRSRETPPRSRETPPRIRDTPPSPKLVREPQASPKLSRPRQISLKDTVDPSKENKKKDTKSPSPVTSPKSFSEFLKEESLNRFIQSTNETRIRSVPLYLEDEESELEGGKKSSESQVKSESQIKTEAVVELKVTEQPKKEKTPPKVPPKPTNKAIRPQNLKDSSGGPRVTFALDNLKSPPNKSHVGEKVFTKDTSTSRVSFQDAVKTKPHIGEKVFTKDTTTTRVSLTGFEPKNGSTENNRQWGNQRPISDEDSQDRVISMASTTSSSSFTSVTSMSSSQSNDTIKTGSSGSPTLSAIDTSTYNSPLNDLSPGLSTPTEANRSSQSTENGLDDMVSRNMEVRMSDEWDVADLTGSQQDLSFKHKAAKEARKQEQELERQERQRLEDILNMCAEYEKQIERERAGEMDSEPPAQPVKTPKQGSTNQELPPWQVHSLEPPSGVQKSDSSGSLEHKDRNSLSKIKTNGSFSKVGSPSNPHKEVSFDFRGRHCSSNSSNSEEEMTSSSQEGTIKRRPNGQVSNGESPPIGLDENYNDEDLDSKLKSVSESDFVFEDGLSKDTLSKRQGKVLTSKSALTRPPTSPDSEHVQIANMSKQLKEVQISDDIYIIPDPPARQQHQSNSYYMSPHSSTSSDDGRRHALADMNLCFSSTETSDYNLAGYEVGISLTLIPMLRLLLPKTQERKDF